MAEPMHYEYAFVNGEAEPASDEWEILGIYASVQHEAGDHVLGLTVGRGRTYKYLFSKLADDGVTKFYVHKAHKLANIAIRPVMTKVVKLEVRRQSNLVLEVKIFGGLTGEPLGQVCVSDNATVAGTREVINELFRQEGRLTAQSTIKFMFLCAGSKKLKNAMCVL